MSNNHTSSSSSQLPKKKPRNRKKTRKQQPARQPQQQPQPQQKQGRQSHSPSNQKQQKPQPQHSQQKQSQQKLSSWKKPVYFSGRGSAPSSRGARPRLENVYYAVPLQKYPLYPPIAKMFSRDEINVTSISSTIKDIMHGLANGVEPGKFLWKIENANQFHCFYKFLLHVEEAQMKVDIRLYDMKAKLIPVEHAKYYLYKVFVPGLAEKRPSILRGDTVFAHDSNGIYHKGYAHFINLDNVLISFCSRSIKNSMYDLEFTFTRTPIRVMHRAVRDTDVIIKRLFHPIEEQYGRPFSSLKLFNPLMNEEQQQAISAVVRKPSRIVVIHGPPGTGKTSTLVEMMTQIVAEQVGARILACSSSNEAADLMCKRLLSFVASRCLLRLNAMSRNPKDIDPALSICSNIDGSSFDIPSLSAIMQKSVVFTTCITAGKLLSMGMKNDHFTHIIIDEAGEALVPETLVPLQLSKKAVIVIAGDSKQLGPVIRSHIALEYRFDISLLEYITDISTAENKTIFHLKKTYRSHPSIVDFYSSMFYNNMLEPKASPQKTNLLLQWSRFKSSRNQSPILVQHLEGLDRRDADSPSWYNSDEITLIVTMINELRKQVQKFRQALQHAAYEGIQVGTVEYFQGKENAVVFISTVRSQSQYLKMDTKFKLGFLDNPKRLNVAISRAIAGLVIVGNMKILSLDEKWRELISMAIRKQAYSGPSLQQLAASQQNVVQGGEASAGISETEPAVNTDAPWKDRE